LAVAAVGMEVGRPAVAGEVVAAFHMGCIAADAEVAEGLVADMTVVGIAAAAAAVDAGSSGSEPIAAVEGHSFGPSKV
jgi:hypothetical protein